MARTIVHRSAGDVFELIVGSVANSAFTMLIELVSFHEPLNLLVPFHFMRRREAGWWMRYR